MTVSPWDYDDAGYKNWLSKHPGGFYANAVKRPQGYFIVHRATCHYANDSKSTGANSLTGPNMFKVTADRVSELLAWGQKSIRGIRIKFCTRCTPGATTDTIEYARNAAGLAATRYVGRPKGVLNPAVKYSPHAQYSRDSAVGGWVLKRANGKCELCHAKAPFLTEAGEPYLECHHIKPSADQKTARQ